MAYFKVNNTDLSNLVQGMKIGYETLVADGSGRNANGDTVLDIINKKVKVYVTFRPMDGSDMRKLMDAIDPYVVNVTFLDSRNNAMTTVNCYTGTPNPEYYWVHNNNVLYKSFELNFIEL